MSVLNVPYADFKAAIVDMSLVPHRILDGSHAALYWAFLAGNTVVKIQCDVSNDENPDFTDFESLRDVDNVYVSEDLCLLKLLLALSV